MKNVIDFLPNLTPDHECLLFFECTCVEHYPFGTDSEMIGRDFCDVCSVLGIELPCECKYAAFLLYDETQIQVRESGNYIRITNSKILLPQ